MGPYSAIRARSRLVHLVLEVVAHGRAPARTGGNQVSLPSLDICSASALSTVAPIIPVHRRLYLERMRLLPELGRVCRPALASLGQSSSSRSAASLACAEVRASKLAAWNWTK